MEQTAQRKGGNQPPISAHPAFPAIVALWFAALFGIGSLVLPVLLIEKMVVAVGMTPPVDFTTRLMIALGMAALGAALGMFIARKVVSSQGATGGRQPRKRKSSEDSAKRPIVATEELGEEGLGPVDEDDADHDSAAPSKPPLPGRRRALSVTDENGRSDYLSHVPLPGEADPYGEAAADESGFDEPMELNEAVMEEVAAHEAEHAEAMDGLRNAAQLSDAPVEAEASESGSVPLFQPGVEASPSSNTERLFDAPLTMPAEDDAIPAEAAPASPDEADAPAYSFAPVASEHDMSDPFANPEPAAPFAAPTSEEEPRQVFGAPQEAAPAPSFAPPQPSAAMTSHSAAALNELSMSDLIARFSASLQRRNEEQADAAAPMVFERAPEEESITSEVAPAETVEAPAYNPFASVAAAEPAPAPFAPPQAEPAAAEAETQPAPAPFAAPQEAAEAQLAPFAPPVEATPAAASAAPAPAPAQDFSQPQGGAMPAALRPLDLSAFEEDEGEEDDPFASGLSLQSSVGYDGRSFAPPAAEPQAQPAPFAAPAEQPAASPAPFAAPADPAAPAAAPFAAPVAEEASEEVDVAEATETGDEGAYSSLLSMKSPLGSHHEFVRIEDEEEAGDLSADGAAPEPVVVFPGQNGQGSPTPSPATDGPRPFDAPPGEQGQQRPLARAVPTTPAQKPADPAETEKALREALEKLQRMSGAA